MKLLLIYLVSICCLCYSDSAVTSQNSGLFGYFGNLWKNPFWSNANVTVSTKIYHAPTEPPTLEQPFGIFDHVKNWVKWKMETTTNKSLEASTKNTNYPAKSSSISKIIERSTQTIASVTETVIDNVTGEYDSTSSEFNYPEFISSEGTSELESSEEIISRSTTAVQTTLVILSNTDSSHQNESTSDMAVSSNETAADSELIAQVKQEVSPLTYREEIYVTFRQYAASRLTPKKRRSYSANNKLTPLNFAFYADDLGNNSLKGEVQLKPSMYYRRTRTPIRRTRYRKATSKKTTSSDPADSVDSDNSFNQTKIFV